MTATGRIAAAAQIDPSYSPGGANVCSSMAAREWPPAETTFRSLQPLSTDYVVEADSVNSFKSRLDKYWANQEFVFNFNSELI